MGIFSSLAGSANPIESFRKTLFLMLAIMVIGLGSYGYHSWKKSLVQEGVNKQVIVEQKETIKELDATVVKSDKAQEKNNEISREVFKDKVVVQDKVIKEVNKTTAKVAVIKAEPTTPKVDKAKEISRVYAVSLWTQYCAATGGTDPGCAENSASPDSGSPSTATAVADLESTTTTTDTPVVTASVSVDKTPSEGWSI